MGVNERLMPRQQPRKGRIAAGSSFDGDFVTMVHVEANTLSATVALSLATRDLSVSPVWYVSEDSKRWRRSAPTPNNPAPVPLIVGPGKDEIAIPAPSTAYGARYVRLSLVPSGSDPGDGDEVSVDYSWRQPSYG